MYIVYPLWSSLLVLVTVSVIYCMCSSVSVLCCLFYVSLGDLLALYYVQFCFGSVLLMFDFSFDDFLALYYVQSCCGSLFICNASFGDLIAMCSSLVVLYCIFSYCQFP